MVTTPWSALDRIIRGKKRRSGLNKTTAKCGRMSRTVSSGAHQVAGAAAPRTGSSGDKWGPDALDSIMWDTTSRRSRRPLDWIIQEQAAA